jgi:REP element-mobilizing transposase RayT
MVRTKRLVVEGHAHHVIVRGVVRRRIFDDDTDRTAAVEALADVVDEHGVRVLGYVLMPNHLHLIVVPSDGGLAGAMHAINTRIACRYAARADRSGHVLQGRYRSIPITHPRRLRMLAVYVAMNPVEAGLCPEPELYAWSSCRFHLNPSAAPTWLDTGPIMEIFGSVEAYRLALRARSLPPFDEEGRPRLAWLVLQGDQGLWLARHTFGFSLRAIAAALDVTHHTVALRLERLDQRTVADLVGELDRWSLRPPEGRR